MKKRKILILIIVILIITFAISKINNKNTFDVDGMTLAVTLDGKAITDFPEQGKYNVAISCKNATGKWLSHEWKLVAENITGDVFCNLDFTSSPSTLKDIVEATTQVNQNGLRYNGLTPDNYLWFNDELWRIIGDIPVKNENGTSENLVKIVRNDSIGSLYYDTLATNSSWGSNTLYTLLNSYYYGKSDATETNYCKGTLAQKCDYTINGIDPDGYYGKMIKNVYWNTGSSTYATTLSKMYNSEISNQTIKGYIGIINASDYGYATTEDFYSLSTWYVSNSTTRISDNNWLHKGSTHTLTNFTSNYLSVPYFGGLIASSVSGILSTRPVVYLDSSVYVVSGSGTEANPYQIAM